MLGASWELSGTSDQVLPFDPDLMPSSLRSWTTDIAHRMQCSPDFPAVDAIAAYQA